MPVILALVGPPFRAQATADPSANGGIPRRVSGRDHGEPEIRPLATRCCIVVTTTTTPSSISLRAMTRRGLRTQDGQPGARLS